MSVPNLYRCVLLVLVLVCQPTRAEDDARAANGTTVGDCLSRQWQRIVTPAAKASYSPSFSDRSPRPLKEYIVGIHPLHNPKRLFAVYGPIVERINRDLPEVRIRLEASRNYEEFDKKLYSGHFDFAMPNPYQTVRSLAHGYRVFGKMADDEDFRGIILVRKDSGIRLIGDLKGKAIAYPAATALAATMMPQQYLHSHGLNINTDIENRYVGSQESSIMNLLLGDVAAAATWPVPWKAFMVEHPEQAAQLEVKWQTEPMVNNGWVVRADVPATLVERFARQLFSLQNDEAGRNLLQAVPVSHFESATEQAYQPVRAFLENFNRTVRPIEQ